MPVGVEPLPPLEVVLEEVVAGLGRLVDGLVPSLLEEVLEELPEVNAPDSIY